MFDIDMRHCPDFAATPVEKLDFARFSLLQTPHAASVGVKPMAIEIPLYAADPAHPESGPNRPP